MIANSGKSDRVKDVLPASGCMLDNYRKNPIVLADHDPSRPVGNFAPRIEDDCVQGVLTFAPRGVSAKADEYCGLYKAGVMNTVSVGFRPIRWTPNKDGEGYTYDAWELVELSCVAVPCDPDATVIARSHRRSLAAIDFDRLSDAEIGKALAEPVAILEVKQLVDAQKSGRVLSAENMARVQAIMKCFGRAMDCRTKALDSHDLTQANLEEFASHIETGVAHAKALMKAGGRQPKPEAVSPDDPDYVDPDEAGDDDDELALASQARKRQIQVMRLTHSPADAPDNSEAALDMSPEQRRAALMELDGFVSASSSAALSGAESPAHKTASLRDILGNAK